MAVAKLLFRLVKVSSRQKNKNLSPQRIIAAWNVTDRIFCLMCFACELSKADIVC